jgi:hypothetical protein
MKTVFTFFLILITFSGCKKAIEKIQQDMVIKAMTDGYWAITNFTEDGTVITSSFMGYKFKYYDDPKTVDAIKNNVTEKTGTWDGNSSSMTTQANFPGATTPLSLINGTWKIDRSGWTYVEATQVSGGVTKKMRLDKM